MGWNTKRLLVFAVKGRRSKTWARPGWHLPPVHSSPCIISSNPLSYFRTREYIYLYIINISRKFGTRLLGNFVTFYFSPSDRIVSTQTTKQTNINKPFGSDGWHRVLFFTTTTTKPTHRWLFFLTPLLK